MTRLLDLLLAFARLSVDRRVERCRRALRRHERRARRRARELRAAEKRLARIAEQVAADLTDWRADKRAAEEAIEMLERKLNVMELANRTLVATHTKLVETQKAEIAVQKTRQAIVAPREEQ